jgi:hypothetical protein
MLRNTESLKRSVERLRLLARVLSGTIIGIAIVSLLGHIFFPEPTTHDYPWIENLLPIVMGLSVLGLALAFRWECPGGVLSIGFFLLQLLLYWIIRGHFFPIRGLLVFFTLPLTAFLFIYLGRADKSRPV